MQFLHREQADDSILMVYNSLSLMVVCRCALVDLQMVNITCRVLSRPSVEQLPTIYRELGTDYDERVLPSIVNGEWAATNNA